MAWVKESLSVFSAATIDLADADQGASEGDARPTGGD